MKKFSEVYGNANSVTLNVTNNCNLNCVYCFEKEKAVSHSPSTSLEESLFLTGRQSKR